LLLLVLLAVVPALGLILYSAWEERQQTAKEVKENALRLARLATNDQERLIEHARNFLTGLAQHPKMLERDRIWCNELFARLLKQHSHYANLGVIDANGTLFCSGLPSPPIYAGDRAYFRRAVETRDFAIGDYQIGRITKKPTINFGHPVLGASRHIVAVVFAALDLAWLNQLGTEAQLPAGTTVTVIDRHGTVIVRYPDREHWVGKSASETPIVKTILAQGEGVSDAPGLDGVPRLHGFTSLGGKTEGAYISIGIPKAAAFAAANRGLIRNLEWFGVVGALTLVLAWFGADLFVLRQVKALRHTAQRLASGDLNVRTSLSYEVGELGNLARTFDQMAESLEIQQAETRRSNEAFRQLAAIVESSDDAIVGTDLDGTITSWNMGAERIYGYSTEEITGRPVSVLIPPDRRTTVPDVLTRLKQGERVENFETTHMDKDGTRIDVSLVFSPIKSATGEIVGTSAIARNITERKRAEEDIEKHAKELARSNAELEQFAYAASHDLQEPLRMVASYTQLLAKRYQGKLDADAEEFIRYAVDGATRMQRLIQDLLALSRVGSRHLEFLPTDCEALLDQALTALKATIEETDALVTHDPLPTVKADALQLIQLFQNLIGNALKYRTEDRPYVHISADREGDTWVFSVRDNGIGIDPKYAERVFEVFERLHGEAEYPGTGIGLAICKKIVERHDGRIWVESEPGKGATFFFTIPAQ
jgi:PAS domain S-box-containing protein